MAGIFGMVIAKDSRRVLPHKVHVASGEWARNRHYYWKLEGKALLGALFGSISQDDYYDHDSGVGVVVQGLPIDPEIGKPISAQTLLCRYREEGCGLLERLDGDYLVTIMDRQRDTLLVANDRMGTCPLHYYAGDGCLAFGPEGWLVCALSEVHPELDEIAVIEFLSMGHAVESRTLLKQVRQLEPAQILEVSLSTAQVHCRTYWELNFQPASRVRERMAASDLYEALSSTVRNVKPSLTDSTQLLLTGGYDSRALLALLCREKATPGRALCWGVSDQIALSDVDVASSVSAFHGVPFQYMHYDHDTFTLHAERWVRDMGLCSDNLGNFIAGTNFLDVRGWPTSLVMNGDQLLGVGGMPMSRCHAFEVASGLPFSGRLSGLAPLLREGAKSQATEMAGAGVRRIVDKYWSEPAKDIQDHLSYRLHVARWLNAPTFFRDPVVSSIRPMLHQPVMALFQTLPGWLRVDKRLLLTMLKQHFPEAFRWPRATADSLVDWKLALTHGGETAAMFERLVCDDRLADSCLSGMLDAEAIRSRLHAYRQLRPNPMSRRSSPSSMVTSIRRWGSRYQAGGLAISCSQRVINRVRGKPVGADSWRILQRLALISLLIRVMECPKGSGIGSRPEIDLRYPTCRWHKHVVWAHSSGEKAWPES